MYRYLQCVVFLLVSAMSFCGMPRTISDVVPFEDDEDTTMECYPDGEISKTVGSETISRLKHKRDMQRFRKLRARRQRLNRKCVDLLEKTICSWVDGAMYMNEKGSVILDAKLCKKSIENDIVATCVTCHENFKFCEIYEHYKKTNHRFFYNARPQKDKIF